MPCVFCGASPTTAEHVIPLWIAPLFPQFAATVGTGEIIRADRSMQRFRIPLFGQTVNAVCATCNNGWMSGLEKGVAPFLGPMLVSAQKTRLRPSQQRLLATWAVKTAFMLQQIHPANQVIPSSEYERLYARKQPPRGYVIWLALRPITDNVRSGREAFTQTRQERITSIAVTDDHSREMIAGELNAGAVFFRSTFAIGNVAFQVFGHNMQKGSLRIGFNTSDPRIDVTRWIWPVQRREYWPPDQPISHIGGFDGLHNVFNPPAR
jgi:hypothetical protein